MDPGSSFDAATGLPTQLRATSTLEAIDRRVQDLALTHDKLGNLTARTDRGWSRANSRARNVSETFTYDSLNRLTRVSGGSSQTLTYDRRGNIRTKTGVGAYAYSATGNRLASVSRSGVTTAYTHDANGNITAGDGRTMKYTGFDKPHSIARGTDTVRFAYGGDRSRYKRTVNGTVTWYVGNVEIRDLGESRMEYRRHVEGGAVVKVTRTTNAEGKPTSRTEDVNYRVTDHLGSVTALLDSSGGLAHDLSYDPWGERRKPDTPLSAIESPATALMAAIAVTPRGFTGHEMLDAVGLIHMNGRVYDPKLGRFLSADPFVQDANDPQLLNRYAYVRNNPLNATDPSGYFASFLVAVVASFIVGKVAAALDLPILSAVANIALCAGSAGIGCAVTFAVGSTFGAGGGFSDALRAGVIAGVSAAAFDFIGETFSEGGKGFFARNGLGHIAAHAFTGGVLSVLQGGKFGHGFVSAGLTKAINVNNFIKGAGGGRDLARTVTAGVIGGTISEATGGKFTNGAVTAAFAQAYNGNREFDQEEVALDSPVGDAPVSSEFMAERTCEKCSRVHPGTDYDVPIGTDVVATADGTAERVYHSGSFGKTVIVNHGPAATGEGNVYTLYAHGFELLVDQGQSVRMGQTILRSGNTGRGTNPHLHYEVIQTTNSPFQNAFFRNIDLRRHPSELRSLLRSN